jgi:hypothetical protein
MLTFPTVPIVNYADIRAQICSGDILLCSGSAIFSRLIQHVTASVWSHVGFVLWEKVIDRIMVMESVESRGVHTIPLSQYVFNYNHTGTPYRGRIFIARHSGLALQDAAALCCLSQRAVDLLDTRYDNQQIASIAIRIAADKLGMNRREAYQDNVFICSEFLDICLQPMGIAVPYDPRGFIAPKDYAECPDIQILWEIATEGPGP